MINNTNKMKKSFLLSLVIFGFFLASTARPVSLQTAQSVASRFMGTNDLQLVTTYLTDKATPAFYVFNTSDGFVIVAADDCETPIIGYSHEGRFAPDNVPVQMEEYLQDFAAKIRYSIENHMEADELTAKQWKLMNMPKWAAWRWLWDKSCTIGNTLPRALASTPILTKASCFPPTLATPPTIGTTCPIR